MSEWAYHLSPCALILAITSSCFSRGRKWVSIAVATAEILSFLEPSVRSQVRVYFAISLFLNLLLNLRKLYLSWFPVLISLASCVTAWKRCTL